VSVQILVVDDEPEVVELIEYHLRQAGYEVVRAKDGAEALSLARKTQPQLIILDVMMPELDGMEACKLLRRSPETSAVPIVMLTARAAEADRIRGLELGADDYVVKPFSPRELVLRVKKLLERASPVGDVPEETLVYGELVIDLPRHIVTWQGEELTLTATEFKLLSTLVARKGLVQSRDVLLKDVWGYDAAIDSRTVDTHMHRLREKLKGAGKFIDTLRGVGYRFVES
jgi:two-component system, OmpR family, phosphate regulon response regulator PhoB